MNELINIVVAAADLAEAEGRALRRGIVRTAVALCLVLAGGMLAIAAVAMLVWGSFLAMSMVLPTAAAAALVGVGLGVFAGALLWNVKRMIQ